MSKRVRLTWKDLDGCVTEEECLLLEEDDKTFMRSDDGDIAVEVELDMKHYAKVNVVAFEDEDGIFVLQPDQVLRIEVL